MWRGEFIGSLGGGVAGGAIGGGQSLQACKLLMGYSPAEEAWPPVCRLLLAPVLGRRRTWWRWRRSDWQSNLRASL
jgi:hypothetical protein